MVTTIKIERTEASPALRLTELYQLREDHAFRRIASLVAGELCGLSNDEIAKLTDPEERGKWFEAFWNRWVEPDSEESLNGNIESGSAELVYSMSQQGVVIDHILHLFAERNPEWRRRVELLLQEPSPR